MYTIRQVCKLLDLKPHVVRYWEQAVPLVSPRKDRYGRRVFSKADVNTLARVKHLVQNKGFTLQGASQHLWEEIRSENANTRSRIAEIRDELLRLKNLVRTRRENLDTHGHS